MNILNKIRGYAAEKGDRIAIRSQGGSLTYEELENGSNRMALWLLDHCGEERTPVVVYGHKSAWMVLCFLACVKSGRAYCPVDETLPADRLHHILEILRPTMVLTPEGKRGAMAGEIGRECTRSVDERDMQQLVAPLWEKVTEQELQRLEDSKLDGEDPFYIIFTSGSTGIPKGVEITGNSLNHYLDWSVQLGGDSRKKEGAVFLNQALFSFDLSVMDLYTCLACGGTLVTMDRQVQEEYKTLIPFLEQAKMDIWVSTPSFVEMCLADPGFCEEHMSALSLFLFCGETLGVKMAGRLLERFPKAVMVNTYGPTESTVAVTSLIIDKERLRDETVLPIGRVKPGTEICIRREDGTAALEGEEGEILILGDTVARGYVQQPELTEKAFFQEERTGGTVMRGYRTGDRGYLQGDMLYFCGRGDGQIKFHGYRIEIGDIEANILRLREITAAVVMPVIRDGQVRSLIAYVEGTPRSPHAGEAMRYVKEELKQVLPAYMIPKKIVFLDRIPMTANGKADRNALKGLTL